MPASARFHTTEKGITMWQLTCEINDQHKVWSFRTRAMAREIARNYRAWGWRTRVAGGRP